jgi:hypothetical protein
MIGHPNLALFIVLSAAAAVSSLPASFQLINFGGKSTFQNTGEKKSQVNK